MLADEVLSYYQRLGRWTGWPGAPGLLEYLRTWDLLTRTLRPRLRTSSTSRGHRGLRRPTGRRRVPGAPGRSGTGARRHRRRTARSGRESGRRPGAAPAGRERRRGTPPRAALPPAHARRAPAGVAGGGRVARPGAPVVGAVITRFAALLDGYAKGTPRSAVRAIVSHGLDTGEHRNPGSGSGSGDRADDQHWFTTAYFHHPAEIQAEVIGAGLELERIAAVESAVWMIAPERLDEVLATRKSRASCSTGCARGAGVEPARVEQPPAGDRAHPDRGVGRGRSSRRGRWGGAPGWCATPPRQVAVQVASVPRWRRSSWPGIRTRYWPRPRVRRSNSGLWPSRPYRSA